MSQIVCDNLVKIYKVADLEVVALQGLDLVVEQGEFIAIVGASGSGKSTLQNILGGMDVPTAGKADVAGFDLTSLTAKERTIYRRSIVGFVWQQTTRNLLPYLSAEENVELPLILEGMRGADRREYAVELLRLVDRVFEYFAAFADELLRAGGASVPASERGAHLSPPSRPRVITLKRPSCGTRFSAMSSCAITFRRAAMRWCSLTGTFLDVFRMPSMR